MANLPAVNFIIARLQEYDPTFELRQGTGFEQLFVEPMQFMVQPFIDEANQLQLAQSFRRILLTNDPDSFDAESVDALANNLFVYRNTGALSGGVARVYYTNPVDREWPAGGAVATGTNSITYSNPAPFQITATEMGAQIENGFYYYDIPLQATATGSNDLAVGGLVSLASDPDYASITNKAPFNGGLPAETNTQLITRAQQSIGVRDLVTGKGFTAVMFGNFQSFLTELQPVGFGDPEMMRDVIYNTHVGGRVDGYVKTTGITTLTKTFVGLLLDGTRQTYTTRNVQLTSNVFVSVDTPNISTLPSRPVVQEVRASTGASYLGTVSFTGMGVTQNLTNSYLNIGVDGNFINILVAGPNPPTTSLADIVFAINLAFGRTVASISNNKLLLSSSTLGPSSQVAIAPAPIGVDASLAVLGVGPVFSATVLSQGTGPIIFVENVDYTVDYVNGAIARIIKPPVVVPVGSAGHTYSSLQGPDPGYNFSDATPGVFTTVGVGDILTIASGVDQGDYRVLSAGGPSVHTLLLDRQPTANATGIAYSIAPPGIKNNEIVYTQFYFNPLSIDVGNLIQLDQYGAVRGVRPGRAAATITDTAFLRIESIELIDPVTLEPIGTTLNGIGGFGRGGFGRGSFGIGSGADYRLVVNVPTARYSAFEDSYIVISSSYLGFSFLVTYDADPNIPILHDFARSEAERVLDGDILMKHKVPAYVQGTIEYTVDTTDSTVPDNDTLQTLVQEFISSRPAKADLIFSDIEQFMIRMTDPFDRFGTAINSFTLQATILDQDGSTTILTGKDRLVVPSSTPAFTTKPLSPRIVHWLGDDVTLTRLN
jgi:hypothetical protein